MKFITLVAGQCCSIWCEGTLRFKLFTGSVEIAGVPVEANRVFTFFLGGRRSLAVYTLEGCVFGLQPESEGDSKLTTEISVLAIGKLLRHIRKGFDSSATSSQLTSGGVRIIVAGSKGSGKFLSACTIANSLNRTRAGGSVFCDLTIAPDGQLSRLGCLGCIETHQDVPLWEGMQWSMYSSSMMFYHGLSEADISLHLVRYLVSVSSACEAALWMSQLKKNVPIIYVLPSIDESTVSHETFYRPLFELINPTHIVFTSEEEGSPQQSFGRLAPSAKLLFCGAVVQNSKKNEFSNCEVERSFIDYFTGNELNPLGVTIMTLPLSSLKFLSLFPTDEGSVEARPFEANEDTTNQCSSLVGRVCVVSLAAELASVPFANVSGHIVITRVSEETNEVEIISPSSEGFVPSPYFLVLEGAIGKAPVDSILKVAVQ